MWTDWSKMSLGSRIWGFTFERAASDRILTEVLQEIRSFCDSWKSHQKPTVCSAQAFYNRFFLISVNEYSGSISGCAIDEMQKRIKSIFDKHELPLANAGIVVWTDAFSNWHYTEWVKSSHEVRKMIAQEAVAVYSPLPSVLSEVHASWPLEAKKSPLFAWQ
jgi:hypothetical protein